MIMQKDIYRVGIDGEMWNVVLLSQVERLREQLKKMFHEEKLQNVTAESLQEFSKGFNSALYLAINQVDSVFGVEAK